MRGTGRQRGQDSSGCPSLVPIQGLPSPQQLPALPQRLGTFGAAIASGYPQANPDMRPWLPLKINGPAGSTTSCSSLPSGTRGCAHSPGIFFASWQDERDLSTRGPHGVIFPSPTPWGLETTCNSQAALPGPRALLGSEGDFPNCLQEVSSLGQQWSSGVTKGVRMGGTRRGSRGQDTHSPSEGSVGTAGSEKLPHPREGGACLAGTVPLW